jgi:hypothetical protein
MEVYHLHPGELIDIKGKEPDVICTKLVLKNGPTCSMLYRPLVQTIEYPAIDKVAILDLEILDSFDTKPYIVKEKVIYIFQKCHAEISIDSNYHNEYNLKAPKNEQAAEIDYIEVMVITKPNNQEE